MSNAHARTLYAHPVMRALGAPRPRRRRMGDTTYSTGDDTPDSAAGNDSTVTITTPVNYPPAAPSILDSIIDALTPSDGSTSTTGTTSDSTSSSTSQSNTDPSVSPTIVVNPVYPPDPASPGLLNVKPPITREDHAGDADEHANHAHRRGRRPRGWHADRDHGQAPQEEEPERRRRGKGKKR